MKSCKNSLHVPLGGQGGSQDSTPGRGQEKEEWSSTGDKAPLPTDPGRMSLTKALWAGAREICLSSRTKEASVHPHTRSERGPNWRPLKYWG